MKSTVGPSQIQHYNNMMTQACSCERQKQWDHAGKMWRECERMAQDNFWRWKETWCAKRAEFCENAVRRGW